MSKAERPIAPKIVSSAHLVSERASGLSELEFGLMVATNAFNRWIVRCMAAVGWKDLGALDVQVLHSVNHRAREKRLSDLCFILNIEDTHLVSYALKKLARLGLVQNRRHGKEMLWSVTATGAEACARYRELREACLIASIDRIAAGEPGRFNDAVGDAAELLRALSGLYDQAARSASSL